MKTAGHPDGRKVLVPMLLLIGLFLPVAGCQGEGPSSSQIPSTGRTVGADGPWAAEFARARAQATSDFERQVLADGVLTEAEFMEALDRRTTCYADRGHPGEIEYLGYGIYGFKHLADGLDEAGRAALSEACDKGTVLVIEPLWNGAVSNPDNEDYSTLVADCLVRSGLVPSGYSGEQYAADSVAGSVPRPPDDPQLVRCEQDPEGLFAGEASVVAPSPPAEP